MMINDFKSNDPPAWCPGCGDYGILTALKKALLTLGKAPGEILLVSGIGQAAKMPHYIRANCFNGLHGRALPPAVGAKIAHRTLTVIVTTGDGDCYGEGGNHFIHNIRRNADITVIVCDNQVYGLTKGQASPTTDLGFQTKVQTRGVILEPMLPLELAIALRCGFVARGYSGDTEHLSWLITQGIRHRGFSLIDVLQPCVSFNRRNTDEWYSQRVYKINDENSYNPEDMTAAYRAAGEWGDRIPIGIIYRNEKPAYEDRSGISSLRPLADDDISDVDIRDLFKDFA